jgi:hypothetical protein
MVCHVPRQERVGTESNKKRIKMILDRIATACTRTVTDTHVVMLVQERWLNLKLRSEMGRDHAPL